jgi:U3 small nucleolar ribonucleoprotein component
MLRYGMQAWDDVERKKKPVEQVGEYKRRIVLEQEKSAQSLAQIYEQEYLNATQVRLHLHSLLVAVLICTASIKSPSRA